jgi:hypothetical protein
MSEEVWKKRKTFLYLGFLGVKKCGDLWILLPCISCMFFPCFLNVSVCVGTILCSLKMGCIRVNTFIPRLETCYNKINDLFETTTTMRVTFIFIFPCLFLEFALGGVGGWK